MRHRFTRSVEIDQSAATVFDWHARPGALERLCPPWERVEIQSPSVGVIDGSRVKLRNWLGPIPLDWEVEHFDCVPGIQFKDRQLRGPFRSWEHWHRFEPIDHDRCRLTDDIRYELPLGGLGHWGHRFVHGQLERLFGYRHEITRRDLARMTGRQGRVLISGASGLLGSALRPLLLTQGYRVDRLVRRPAQQPDEIQWDPSAGRIDWPDNYACDAVIHLAGANIAGGRWTTARRELIRRSRVEGTRALVAGLRQLAKPPSVLLSGSAVGIYGTAAHSERDESAPVGSDFLAEVCVEWEREAEVVREFGVRTVLLRSGAVLSATGGALGRMLPAFRLGFGGRLGSGGQAFPWIGIEDFVWACLHLLETEAVDGPVNLVAPETVSQREFARTLGRVLGRPAMLPAPAGILRLILGEMADAVLLAGVRVKPERLTASGYVYLHPSLEKTLRHVLGRPLGS